MKGKFVSSASLSQLAQKAEDSLMVSLDYLDGSLDLGDLTFGFPTKKISSVTESRVFNFFTQQGLFFHLQFVYSYLTWSPNYNILLKLDDRSGNIPSQSLSFSSSKLFISPEDGFWSFEAEGISMKLVSATRFTLKLDLKEIQAEGEFFLDRDSVDHEDRGIGEGDAGGAFRVTYRDSAEGANQWTQKFVSRLTGDLAITSKKPSAPTQIYPGNVMLSHMIQTVKPWQTSATVSFMNFHSRQLIRHRVGSGAGDSGAGSLANVSPTIDTHLSVIVQQVVSPHKLNNRILNFALVYQDGKIVGVTDQVKLGDEGLISSTIDPTTKCTIPDRLLFQAKGTYIPGNGDSLFNLQVERNIGKGGTLIDRLNVLDTLPALVRGVVKAFIKNPFVYRYLDQGEAILQVTKKSSVSAHEKDSASTITNTTFEYLGMGFSELAFIEY